MGKPNKKKKPARDNTDYGAGELNPTGIDRHGNPLFVRDNPRRDKVALKLYDAQGGHSRHAVNQTCCPIDTLLEVGMICQTARDAGARFSEDYHRAGLHPQMGMTYSMQSRSSSGGDIENDQAYSNWTKAVQAMGPGYGDIVCTIVCHEDLPTNSGEIMRLKEGLRRLATHYGMWMKE